MRAANRLGLTAQNPVREVYLTSGPSRRLQFGSTTIEMRHPLRWQLAALSSKAGDVIRALAWLGPREIDYNLNAVLPRLTAGELGELAGARAVMSAWMAEAVSAHLPHG